jgi:hypothetical protein
VYSLLLLGLIVGAAGCSGGSSSGGGETGFGEISVGDGPASLQLSWNEPSSNEDGSQTANLSYRVYVSESDGSSAQALTVGNVTSLIIHGLQPGVYTVAVTAVNDQGIESDPSQTALIETR